MGDIFVFKTLIKCGHICFLLSKCIIYLCQFMEKREFNLVTKELPKDSVCQ